MILTAPWVFLDETTAIPDGALLVEGGRVRELGPRAELTLRHPRAPIKAFRTYLGPQAANAHTHLDLGLGPVFKGPFVDFVEKAVLPKNATRGQSQAKQAARASVQRTLGDIAAKDPDTVRWWLSEAPFEGVVFWEVLGLGSAQEARALAEVQEILAQARRWQRPDGPRLGLSPHAPYSLSPRLMRAVVELAREEGLPLMIHLAESPAERTYFLERRGPLAAFYRRRGVPLDLHPVGLSPVAYLAELGVLEARPLVVHGVQVDAADLRLLAEHRVTLVSCPRSNLNLEAGLPPYAAYRELGIPIALGTDSALSGGSLDVWDEVRTLIAQGLPAREAIGWALAGHRALGRPVQRIQPGTPIDRVVGW